MANSSVTESIRITKVGGRYLVFEVKDVASLRRDHCICAVFVGTTPQNPTQNVFQGLPIELLAEEAKLLVEKNAAYIVDDAASHLARLSSFDEPSRKAYIKSLKTRRRNMHIALQEEQTDRKKQGAQKRAKQTSKKSSSENISKEVSEPGMEADDLLFAGPTSRKNEKMTSALPPAPQPRHLTATATLDMLEPTAYSVPIDTPRGYPLYRHLNSRGFYITPGIRFGADYSVYPGDPFRYHAHFMATSYEWDEEITMLDLVSGGRLGTAVKKGFLIGGQAPPSSPSAEPEDDKEDRVRAFTIEWAAM